MRRAGALRRLLMPWPPSHILAALNRSPLLCRPPCHTPCILLARSFAVAVAQPAVPSGRTDAEDESKPRYVLPSRRSIRQAPRAFDPAVPSLSRLLLEHLTTNGPATRRQLYTLFGQIPGLHSHPDAITSPPPPPSSNPPPSSPAAEQSTAAASASPPSPASRVRSKRHLSALLQQLVESGRVLTRPNVVEGSKVSQEFVYVVRDYARSWNKHQQSRLEARKAERQQKRSADSVQASTA